MLALVHNTGVLADKSKRSRHRHVVNDLRWNGQVQPLMSVPASAMQSELQRKMANPFLTRRLRCLYYRLHAHLQCFRALGLGASGASD